MHEDDNQGNDSETETEKGSDGDDDRTIATWEQTSQDAEYHEKAKLEQEIQDEIGTRKDYSSRMRLPSA
jgi:hypothetical protein